MPLQMQWTAFCGAKELNVTKPYDGKSPEQYTAMVG